MTFCVNFCQLAELSGPLAYMVSLLDCSCALICDVIQDLAFSYVNRLNSFFRLTEVCSYLYIIHLYLSISRPVDGGPAFSTRVKFDPLLPFPRFQRPRVTLHP